MSTRSQEPRMKHGISQTFRWADGGKDARMFECTVGQRDFVCVGWWMLLARMRLSFFCKSFFPPFFG